MHNLSYSEPSENHAVKIYAQFMNYRIYAKILNSLSTINVKIDLWPRGETEKMRGNSRQGDTRLGS